MTIKPIVRIQQLEQQKSDAAHPSDRLFRERYAQQILDSIPDMLSVYDRQSIMYELVSADHTNHTGLPIEAIKGRPVTTFLNAQSARNVIQNLSHAFDTGEIGTSHHDITVDGVTRNYENRIVALDDQYALCMCRDITDSVAFKHHAQILEHALDNIDEEIYACTSDGTMIYANRLFRDRHKIDKAVSHYKIYEFWSFRATADKWQERLNKIRRNANRYEYTIQIKDANGKLAVWDIIASIFQDQTAEQETIWFFGRNVSARIEHENKIKEMNSILDSIMSSIPVCVFVKDPSNDFRYLYWNNTFEQTAGFSAEEVVGKNDTETFSQSPDYARIHQSDLELLQKGEVPDRTTEHVFPSGAKRIISVHKQLAPVEGRLPLIVGIAWDVTEQKLSEERIIAARQRAETSNNLKSAFLANMSHEIRTPLNAIVGFSKLIATAETEDEKAEYADIIDRNSDLLLRLINDILDISKIEAGTLEFRPEKIDLNELCHSEYEVLKTRVKEGVTLIFDRKYDEASLFCDPNRLAQVITNLIGNAAKFTEKGEIRFGFDKADDRIDFYVTDTGRGIAPDKIDAVFDRFVKLNDYAAGTGLGLAISKTIVEHMGGTIRVESELGHGSRFYFSIPVKTMNNE